MYSTDLAYIHDAGFSDFAARAVPELVNILSRNGIRRGLVVDVGCGSGVLAKGLIEAGYDVVGVDVSPAMIRLARARVRRGTFRVGSIATLRLPRCVAVVALNEVVNYVPGRLRALEHGEYFRVVERRDQCLITLVIAQRVFRHSCFADLTIGRGERKLGRSITRKQR